MPPPMPPTRRAPRWPWFVAGTGVLIGVLGVLFGLGVFGQHDGPSSPGAPATFTMTGFIRVHGTPYTDILLDGNGGCSGTGGYSDMNSGTAVTVANGTGQTVATGSLGAGRAQDNDCVFPITVSGVPADLQQYSVTVSHRGTQVITATEAKDGLELTLGN